MSNIDDLLKQFRPEDPQKSKRPSAQNASYRPLKQLRTDKGSEQRTNSERLNDLSFSVEENTLDQDRQSIEKEDEDFYSGGLSTKEQEILDVIDQNSKEEVVEPEKYDLTFLKRLLLKFERAINTNAELRIKFASEPSKFMASEIDLDNAIKSLSLITNTRLYQEFIDSGSVDSLVSLLSHENSDIIVEAVKILGELIDEDVESDADDVEKLVDHFIFLKVHVLLVRFLEDSEAEPENEPQSDKTFAVLTVVEHLISFYKAAVKLLQDTSLAKYLLQEINKYTIKPSSERLTETQRTCAELLASALIAVPKQASIITEIPEALDTLLQSVAIYRAQKPNKSVGEDEYAENLFDTLRTIVRHPACKDQFLDNEGVELMVILLGSKWPRSRALGVIEDCMKGSTGLGPMAERIIESGSLKPLFSILKKVRIIMKNCTLKI